MKDYSYYDGTIAPYDAITVPLSDRAIFFGEAVYDVMIGRNGKLYQAKEHLSRLRRNSERLSLPLSSDEEIGEIIQELIRLSGYSEYSIYIQVSGDARHRAHRGEGKKSNLLITVTQYQSKPALSEIKATVMPDLRYGYCDIKTVNLLPAVLSINEAAKRGADVAIFEKDGMVTECSHANILILNNGKLITHPLDTEILPGVMRANLIRKCIERGIEVEERAFPVEELFSADSVLVTSTTQFVKVCTEIDGVRLVNAGIGTAEDLFSSLYSDYLSATC